jgi:putative aldouronate transport system substrate-binding protein
MKKLVALFLAMVMVLSMASIAVAEEPFEITILLPEFPADIDFVMEDNPVLNKIQELSGVKLNIQWGPNSTYGDILNTTLADQNPPMLIAATDARAPIVVNSARAGAFWDLTEAVKDAANYPNLAAGNEGVYNNIAVDGHIYGIYRSRAFPRGGIYYRCDIAKEAGIEKVPETLDELTALAEALAAYGKEHDAYALNMCSYTAGTVSVITVAFGAPNVWGVNAEGNIYPAHEDPAYLEGLNWLRHLYEIGGIDPNFVQISTSDWDNIERTNKAYMRFDCLDNAHRQQEWFEKEANATEQMFMSVGPLAKADGSITVWPQNAGFNGEILVTKSVKEEDLPKVLKFLDWCNGSEGQTLINAGLEGLTFDVNENGHRYVPAEKSEEYTKNSQMYHNNINQLGMGVPGNLENPKAELKRGLTDLRQRYEDLNAQLAPYAVLNPCYPFVSETYTAFGTDLDTRINDAAAQYIAGMIDEDGLRAAWQEWSDMGGAKVTDEYNEAYHAAQQQ